MGGLLVPGTVVWNLMDKHTSKPAKSSIVEILIETLFILCM